MWLIILSFLLVYTLLQIHSPGEDSAIFFDGEGGTTFTAARLKPAVLFSFISQHTSHAEVNEKSAESNCLGISYKNEVSSYHTAI